MDSLLFPVEPVWPPGFIYERNFITREEEQELLRSIREEVTVRNSQYHEYTARRKSAHFGLKWNYGTEVLEDVPPAPEFLQQLAAKVARRFSLPVEHFPHVLVIEYPPGAPMGWHRDAPPFAVIYGISLGSTCQFGLRPNAEALRTKENTLKFDVEPRSLYMMSGQCRSQWQHSVWPVKDTRYSITLRTMGRQSSVAGCESPVKSSW
jgi:alkylated DNA repair dioxygenase AlkB